MPYIPKNVGEVTEIKAFISQASCTLPGGALQIVAAILIALPPFIPSPRSREGKAVRQFEMCPPARTDQGHLKTRYLFYTRNDQLNNRYDLQAILLQKNNNRKKLSSAGNNRDINCYVVNAVPE